MDHLHRNNGYDRHVDDYGYGLRRQQMGLLRMHMRDFCNWYLTRIHLHLKPQRPCPGHGSLLLQNDGQLHHDVDCDDVQPRLADFRSVWSHLRLLLLRVQPSHLQSVRPKRIQPSCLSRKKSIPLSASRWVWVLGKAHGYATQTKLCLIALTG